MATDLTTQQNATAFDWPPRSARAAVLLGAHELSDSAIARKLHMDRVTLWRWQQLPEFMARVREHEAEYEAAVLRLPIAKKGKRVAAQNDRWERGLRLMAARAGEYADIPGGDTGWLVKQQKLSATGEVVIEYQTDSAMLSELRALEKQAAQELGQVSEGKGDKQGERAPVDFTFVIQGNLQVRGPQPVLEVGDGRDG